MVILANEILVGMRDVGHSTFCIAKMLVDHSTFCVIKIASVVVYIVKYKNIYYVLSASDTESIRNSISSEKMSEQYTMMISVISAVFEMIVALLCENESVYSLD